MSIDEILYLQLDTLHYNLHLSLAHGKKSLIVIHGLGKGKLRVAVHEILSSTDGVVRYINEWKGGFGYGATEVFFE